ncbi:MAG: site-specific integrase [Ilumatobacter sp.]
MADQTKPATRGNSKPNVKKRGSGYTYYLYVTDADGRRRQHSKGGFKTQREAEDARIAAMNAKATGAYVKAEKISVRDFLVDEWLPSRLPPAQEESTWHSYDQKIRLHVIPYIGSIPLQQLSPVDLNKLYRHLLEAGRRQSNPQRRRSPAVYERAVALRADGFTYEQTADALRAEFERESQLNKNAVASLIRRGPPAAIDRDSVSGLSARTVRYIHTIMHAAFKDALRWNRVVRNVADAATPPSAASARATRPKVWTADQLRAFLDHVAESRYLPAWIFLATSGCRRGECLGLKWSDADLDAGTAVISRQVTAIDHRVVVKDVPKTKHGHLIRLDGGTVAMLRRLRSEQAEEKLRLGPGYADEGYVFCQWDGQPYHPERFSREFDRNREYFNRDHPDDPLPPITLHGLRHTWATLALRAGIDIKIVSERLNHGSTTITREIYTHVTPPMQSDAAEMVGALILGR